MSYKAYQTAAARTEDPRSTEYRLFGQVTRALLSARECGPMQLSQRADALDWNRRMWTAFAADCSSEDNALPESLRAAIISLSLFVSRQTSEAIRDDDAIDTLVEINRTIMQGLAPQGQGEASAA
ncbi:MAG: flagellar biosynthesis regulator FlaF [Caulobacterales bacterium]|uniref:flagellar biosynthesis regulator FlaF n=1 Tax=Glycocaulis sp. TaxID=1969725 RepID=UPI003FA1769F